jgi:hypothetical protein
MSESGLVVFVLGFLLVWAVVIVGFLVWRNHRYEYFKKHKHWGD